MTTERSVSEQTYQYFAQEAADLLKTIDRELQDLRQDFSLQRVHALMRAAHTLKGASASVGLETLQETTHSLEDIFKALCYSDTVISPKMERLIFAAYDCLQILMAAQLEGSQVDEADVLDRMAAIVAQLQEMLGDRFGQEGHLPTSSELGFDMTQSIFELGVTQRLDALSVAIKRPEPLEQIDPDLVRDALQTCVEVFSGLGESLDLPGFEEIAKVTGQALQHHPEQVLEIAPVALENFKMAQMAVLAGDRTEGGSPSAALRQFCRASPSSVAASDLAETSTLLSMPIAEDLVEGRKAKQSTAQSRQRSWLKRRWQMLMNPLGHRTKPSSGVSSTKLNGLDAKSSSDAKTESQQAGTDAADADSSLLALSQLAESVALSTTEVAEAPNRDARELLDLTPTDLETLNVAPLPAHSSSEVASVLQTEPRLDSAPESLADLPLSELSALDSEAYKAASQGATIRMSVEHLEQLNQTMGELLTQQNRQLLYHDQLTALIAKLLERISQQQRQLRQQQDRQAIYGDRPIFRTASDKSTADFSEISSSAYEQFDRLELDRYSDIQLLLQACLEETVQQSESAEAIELFLRRSGQSLEKQKRLLSHTRETLLEARMVPLSTAFERCLPAVKRLQSHSDKQVDIATSGGDILVDKAIADKLFEPLLHLVRNAFDHGIESPEQRAAARKSLAGSIHIGGVQQGRHLTIRVRDDGQGLNLDRIRKKAVEVQLITPDAAEQLSFEETVDLLFEPGFSTASETDTVSGRGVGLDVVQASVRSLQGWVSVSQAPDTGTCFTLQIPATLTIAKLLLCQAQGRTYALIADAIEHILIPTDKQVRSWKGGKMLSWQMDREEYLVPVNALDEVLHYASPMSDRGRDAASHRSTGASTHPVVLLRHQDTLVGLEVDQLLGEQELVISPLGQTIVPPAYLYGSSILPDGQLSLVLDGLMLAKIIVEQRQQTLEVGAASQPLKSEQPTDKPVFAKKLILTIDDSITVRNTLAEALQRANYQVIQARDGEEALQQLERYRDVQAILCDIEMPRMNGFEFLKARQQRPAIADIPTIMLTSRTGSKHRVLTEELGATTYITKPYLTPKLLQMVADVIKTPTCSLLNAVGENHE